MKQRIRFRKLVESSQIGRMVVKNRMIMAPMGTALSDERGLVTREMENYYEARARGGVGMVIVENAGVDFPQGRQRMRSLSIYGERTLEGLSRLANVIQKHGARAAIQLHHAGRVAQSRITGLQPVGPSPIAAPNGELPQELTLDGIATIVTRFRDAALLARKAGFDAVEIHAAHHYLIAQFLSRASNRRHDQYGGSVINRTRLLLEIIHGIREAVSEDFPVWVRINGGEFGIENGLTLEESLEIATSIAKTSVDAISVSAFGYGRFESTIKPETPGALIPLAAAIKKVVEKPIMAAGMITPKVGEEALRKGEIDLVVLGRALIADPEFPNKVTSGIEHEIRPCICCYYCDDSRSDGGSIRCSVNAATGREGRYVIRSAKKVKRVLIVGGGPAGMEAARIAALRGCQVRVYEKGEVLGGQLILASVPPHKEKIRPLLEYFHNQLKKLGVEIELETEVTEELIEKTEADAVILSTGIDSVGPLLPVIDRKKWFFAHEVLAGNLDVGDRVVIIGGGMVGCETAEFLEERGVEVTLVEILPELATNMRPTPKRKLLERLDAKPINIFTETACKRITQEGLVIVPKEGSEMTVPTDTIIFATGGTPNKALYDSLRESLPKLLRAGDCVQPRGIAEAIEEGMKGALCLDDNDESSS
jgi:2,4-dienoyl-CoA reductase-like NADH-dependent reductase (Old Yellow Enzyme family)/thioredoxin reductase